MTLAVPELGPALGRLVVPRRLREPWVSLDDVREGLVTAVMESAGTARRHLRGAAPARALAALDRDAWNRSWEEAVRAAADRVVSALDRTFEIEARRVRMPSRWHRRFGVSAAERRAIASRLASGVDGLDAALGEVARLTASLQQAWPGDESARAEWRAAEETAARRLEAAWLALEAQVEKEHARWTPELDAVRTWRPSLWPVFAIWSPFAVITLWLGLVLGGYLPAPQWLAVLLGF